MFFGWWSVIAGGLLALWGHGFYSVGIAALFKPIALELGFSRAATSVAASIGRFEGGIEAPLVGWVTDKFGPRRVVLLGVCVMSLGLIIGTGLNVTLLMPRFVKWYRAYHVFKTKPIKV